MKITETTLVVALVGVILIESVCFYSYWYDHEYPHGYTYVTLSNDTIEYHSDNYFFDDDYYVSFDGGKYYVLGYGVKEKIESELEHWNKIFNTTNFLVEKPTAYPENTSYSFRLYYHTEDFPFECSNGYYKQVVLDDFELSSYGWHHN